MRKEAPSVHKAENMEILLDHIKKLVPAKTFDVISEIPGTVSEKKVYQMLVRLGVRFQFKYNWMENFQTNFKESSLVPSFILPDIQDSVIEVMPPYTLGLHNVGMDGENMKRQYALIMGYTIIQYGIPLIPAGNVTGAKYVIWTEDEIRQDIDNLFQRDLPEVFREGGHAVYEPENFTDRFLKDRYSEMQRLARLEKSRIVKRMMPKAPTLKSGVHRRNKGKTQPSEVREKLSYTKRQTRTIVQQPEDLGKKSYGQ
jgi:hypothetical protein